MTLSGFISNIYDLNATQCCLITASIFTISLKKRDHFPLRLLLGIVIGLFCADCSISTPDDQSTDFISQWFTETISLYFDAFAGYGKHSAVCAHAGRFLLSLSETVLSNRGLLRVLCLSGTGFCLYIICMASARCCASKSTPDPAGYVMVGTAADVPLQCILLPVSFKEKFHLFCT